MVKQNLLWYKCAFTQRTIPVKKPVMITTVAPIPNRDIVMFILNSYEVFHFKLRHLIRILIDCQCFNIHEFVKLL